MPLVEVIHAHEEPLAVEQKRAFARAAETILREVLGTPPGRMRLAFFHVAPDDSLGLLAPTETSPDAHATKGGDRRTPA